jgi:L-2-hydroxyglutarate oxidase LhgO
MDKTDVIVIGAGAVGLAVAATLGERLPGRSVIVIERHDAFGREASSRNSEVIHAGIYYPNDSLKARLCVRGRRLLYEFLDRYEVPHRKTGKLVVAADASEEPLVEALRVRALANGVEDAVMLTRDRIREMEPGAAAVAALYSPSTGIFDTHTYMKRLESLGRERGVDYAYNCEAVNVRRANDEYRVSIRDADGELMEIGAAAVVNCGGLSSDTVAALPGIDIDAADYRLHLSKGEYFKVSGLPRWYLNHLVYPVPGTTFLGIHIVLDLAGGIKLGPNAAFADAVDYTVDPAHAGEFFAAAQRYLPALTPAALSPDMAGMRAKLQKPGELFRDFVIVNEKDRGLPGFINCVGIESPGLTSSLAIAEYVAGLL